MLESLHRFSAAQPAAALRPDYSDLWFLYDIVRDRRPSTLLEFGSGCSTPVIAAAVRANGSGHLWTLDGDESWSHATRAALPLELRDLVTIVHAPIREDDRDVRGWSHENVPELEPDFIYLDSPALTPKRQVAFDPLDLEERFSPGFVMVVDGRQRNAEYLRERLQRLYRVTRMPGRHLFELLD